MVVGAVGTVWAADNNSQIICGASYELVNGECVAAFEEETKDMVIKQLIEENNRIIAENVELKRANHDMGVLVTDLQNKIAGLEAIVLEQIRVIISHFK